MLFVSIVFMLFLHGIQSQNCPIGQQPCGSTGCYDPAVQGCSNGGTTIQCINSCNGTCYSNRQYCYNNTIVCNNGESVCDVKNYNYFTYFPYNLTCYNSSQFICHNNTMCYPQYSCGGKCMTDYRSTCADNQTICSVSGYWEYYPYSYRFMKTCGPRKVCYDNSTHVCLNGTTVCPGLNARFCGSACYNPDTQTCSNGTVRCINSCNGTCFSVNQYCYNSTLICNNGESVCDVKNYNYFTYFPYNLTCYNSSQFICHNNTLCYPQYSCGGKCMTDYRSTCADNQTICSVSGYWEYYPYSYRFMKTCGPRKVCYDNSTHVCLNGTTVCPGLNARFCGSACYNPDTQTCSNGTVRCINSCNGTCFSANQYCYNSTLICNNGESVCDVKNYNYFTYFPYNLTCYNSSQLICHNNTLCYPQYSCGGKCMTDYRSTCADNQTICSVSGYWEYYPYSYRFMKTCGPRKVCYDNSTHLCTDNNGTICPIGSQLCSGICYNPESQYCAGGNNTIFCLNNPLSSSCTLTSTSTTRSTTFPITTNTSARPFNSTSTTVTLPTACDVFQNCTLNSDCCRPGSVECQCFRHSPDDTYGSCIDPNVTPICGDRCPVKSACRYDSDCCKNQCAEVRFADADGRISTKKYCIPR